MGEQHADLICWEMQGPRAIPCLIAVRQTAGLVGRVQSSLPLALPFTSKLASFWMGLGSLGSRREGEGTGKGQGDKCGETTTRTRQVETNSEGGRRSTTSLAPRRASKVGLPASSNRVENRTAAVLPNTFNSKRNERRGKGHEVE